jgi:hypothetical protein
MKKANDSNGLLKKRIKKIVMRFFRCVPSHTGKAIQRL